MDNINLKVDYPVFIILAVFTILLLIVTFIIGKFYYTQRWSVVSGLQLVSSISRTFISQCVYTW